MTANSSMRNAGVPPHIKNVGVCLEVMRATLRANTSFAKIFGRILGEPSIRALLTEELNDRIERVVIHDSFATVGTGEGRDRNSPVALTTDAPVGTTFNHRANALDGVRRIERYLFKLRQRLLSQRTTILKRLIHGNKPLACSAENNWLFAAPAMWIAVINILMQNERTALLKPRNDLGVSLINLHARPRATGTHGIAHKEMTIIINWHYRGNAKLLACQIVVHTMTRSTVNNACTIIKCDVIGVDKLARLALIAKDRLLITIVSKLFARSTPWLAILHTYKLKLTIAEFLYQALGESLCHNLSLIVMDKCNVGSLWMTDHCIVCRKRPRCRGPNINPETTSPRLEAFRNGGHLKTYENGRAYFIAILNLSFRKSRMAVTAPMNRL